MTLASVFIVLAAIKLIVKITLKGIKKATQLPQWLFAVLAQTVRFKLKAER